MATCAATRALRAAPSLASGSGRRAHAAGLAAAPSGGRRASRTRPRAAGAGGAGGGVLDKPAVKPGEDKRAVRQKKKPPKYRVMLHNDNVNRREYVVRVLMKVIPEMTIDLAMNIMQEAHVNQIALVIVCTQEEAEGYVESLRANGLISTMEPDGGGGGGNGGGDGGQ